MAVRRNHFRGFNSCWDDRKKPICESLFEKRVIVAYGLRRESTTTENPRLRWWWYVARDARSPGVESNLALGGL